ncbi:MAG: hypothetical protein ABSF53_15410 [Terracidiphilus sp.]|jgi:hypothetical protein
MEHEPNQTGPDSEFERELRQAFQRRPAPPGLKRKLMEKRKTRSSLAWQWVSWQRLAATLVLTSALAGGVAWRNREERRKEEAAREQVLTALRITSRALNQMNTRLAAHARAAAQD